MRRKRLSLRALLSEEVVWARLAIRAAVVHAFVKQRVPVAQVDLSLDCRCFVVYVQKSSSAVVAVVPSLSRYVVAAFQRIL